MTSNEAARTAVREWLTDIESPVDHTHMSERFWRLTTFDDVDDVGKECIRWKRQATGYPMFSVRNTLQYAHRIAVRIGLDIGTPPRAIPEGMVVDHVKKRGCMGVGCVNPHHLEVVTRKENTARIVRNTDPNIWR